MKLLFPILIVIGLASAYAIQAPGVSPNLQGRNTEFDVNKCIRTVQNYCRACIRRFRIRRPIAATDTRAARNACFAADPGRTSGRPSDFNFFQDINELSQGQGLLGQEQLEFCTLELDQGLEPAGCPGYHRLSTIAISLNHQPVLNPVAQRGPQEDCTRFCINGSIPTHGELKFIDEEVVE